jgi:hypothetical protein
MKLDDLTAPGMEDPGMLVPGMVDPGLLVPGMVDPGMLVPGMVDPGLLVPGMVDPGLAPLCSFQDVLFNELRRHVTSLRPPWQCFDILLHIHLIEEK